MNDTSPRDDAPPSPSAAGKGKTGQFRAGDLVLFKEGDDRTPALILDVADEDEEETLYTLEYVGWRRSWNTDEAASTLCSRRPGSTTHKRTLLLINNTRAIVAAIEKARKGKPYRISDWVEVPGWGVGKVIDKCFRPVPHAPGTYHLSYYVKFALKKQEKFDNWVTNAQIKRTVAAPAKAKGGRGDVFNECTEPTMNECTEPTISSARISTILTSSATCVTRSHPARRRSAATSSRWRGFWIDGRRAATGVGTNTRFSGRGVQRRPGSRSRTSRTRLSRLRSGRPGGAQRSSKRRRRQSSSRRRSSRASSRRRRPRRPRRPPKNL